MLSVNRTGAGNPMPRGENAPLNFLEEKDFESQFTLSAALNFYKHSSQKNAEYNYRAAQIHLYATFSELFDWHEAISLLQAAVKMDSKRECLYGKVESRIQFDLKRIAANLINRHVDNAAKFYPNEDSTNISNKFFLDYAARIATLQDILHNFNDDPRDLLYQVVCDFNQKNPGKPIKITEKTDGNDASTNYREWQWEV